jgi:hypothetical protein
LVQLFNRYQIVDKSCIYQSSVTNSVTRVTITLYQSIAGIAFALCRIVPEWESEIHPAKVSVFLSSVNTPVHYNPSFQIYWSWLSVSYGHLCDKTALCGLFFNTFHPIQRG